MSGGTPSNDEEDERDRRTTNIFLLVAAALSGVWLVDALLEARKADDCMSAGRRNCTPVERLPR